VALIVLCAAGAPLLWKMLSWHDRLLAIQDNDRWEKRLEAADAYRNGSVLFYGDSEIAYWPMAESFGQLPIRNRGVKGEMAQDTDARFAQELARIRPVVTVVLIGTNDLGNARTLQATMSHIDGLLKQVEGRAILCSLLPAAGTFSTNRRAADLLLWNQHLALLASRHGDPFVDLYSRLADHDSHFRTELTVDGLHPNASGYAVMTAAIWPQLARMSLRNLSSHDPPPP
jgi:lysophospholipase L1-like esterase